jgi:hypothetical protein
VIAGSEIRVLDAQGSQLDSLPYSVEAAVASAFFTELFGAEPVVTTVESDGPCVPNAAIELWDDAFRLAHGDVVLPEGQRVVVAADAAEAHGIALATPGGVAVGDPIDLLKRTSRSSRGTSRYSTMTACSCRSTTTSSRRNGCLSVPGRQARASTGEPRRQVKTAS